MKPLGNGLCDICGNPRGRNFNHDACSRARKARGFAKKRGEAERLSNARRVGKAYRAGNSYLENL